MEPLVHFWKSALNVLKSFIKILLYPAEDRLVIDLYSSWEHYREYKCSRKSLLLKPSYWSYTVI